MRSGDLAPGRLEQVRAAVRHRPLPIRRSLVDALVEEVRVRRREHIAPVLRLPNGRPAGAIYVGDVQLSD